MKIIILGAGQVGMTVAMNLVGDNDITVVDREPQLLRNLQERLDLRTVQGYGAHPDILRLAGAEDADMLLAVTNNDETNMVACQVAYTLFRTPKKIARVRALSFTRHMELFGPDAMPIDVVISPEQLVTDYIGRLIEYPGALQVLDFADGKVRLVAVRAVRGGMLVGNELRTIYRYLPNIDARVAAIYRQGKPIHPEGETVIEVDDEVFFIAATQDIPKVMGVLREAERPYRKLIFAGGGNIGRRLALMLQGSHRIKLIERDPEASERLARELNRTIILTGNAADQNLLLEENIENTDVFCAITNDEEANILSAMLAKRLGARKVMSLINRASYVDLVENSPIDIAISPQQATISELLTHIRKGDVKKVHSLRRGAAEAMEAIAHGTPESSKVVGRCIDEIKLPPGTVIGAMVRGEQVLMAHHDTVVESGDHVILFLVDKRAVRDVERLFQVGVTFL